MKGICIRPNFGICHVLIHSLSTDRKSLSDFRLPHARAVHQKNLELPISEPCVRNRLRVPRLSAWDINLTRNFNHNHHQSRSLLELDPSAANAMRTSRPTRMISPASRSNAFALIARPASHAAPRYPGDSGSHECRRSCDIPARFAPGSG